MRGKGSEAAILALVVLVTAAQALASPGSSARSLGLAGAYTAVAGGVEAPMWNPANLGLPGRSVVSIRVPSVGAEVYNNSFSLGQYDRYFTTGQYLDESAKNDLLGSIPTDGARADVYANADALALSWGHTAFSIHGWAPGYGTLSRDWFELLLNGNELGRTYDLDADGEGYAVAEAAFSTARDFSFGRFQNSAFGVSFKYLRGLYYAGVAQSDLSFAALPTGFQSHGAMIARLAQGGNGFALDLGVASALNDRYRVGVSLLNLGSGIRWDRETEEREFRVNADSLLILNSPDSLNEVLDQATWDTTRDISSFASRYPTFLKAGISRETEKLLLSLDYEQGFSRGPGVTTTPRLSLGLEYRPFRFLPLRTGMSVGGLRGFFLGSGFGLDFSGYVLDVALANDGLTSGSARGLAFALTQTLYFGRPTAGPPGVPETVLAAVVGKVTDLKTGQPLPATIVALDRAGISLTQAGSDSVTGQFVLSVPVTEQTVLTLGAGRDGYISQQKTVAVAGGETTRVAFSLAQVRPAEGFLRGVVKDAETNAAILATVVITPGGLPGLQTDATSGIFFQNLAPGAYSASAAAPGFDSLRGIPFSIQDQETTSLILVLNPTFKTGTTWVFRNISFDPQEPLVLPESYSTLDAVVKTLHDNPRLRVEIGVHSDSRGSKAPNQKVSQERADAIRAYFVRSGISSDRLVSKGYGGEKPLASNKTKEGRAQNRRVEITVTGR
jgi:outer membrane protein OmpA-like peptidoglycan-associated protein